MISMCQVFHDRKSKSLVLNIDQSLSEVEKSVDTSLKS